MQIERPDTLSTETLDLARPAADTLRAWLAAGTLPPELAAGPVGALLAIVAALSEAAIEDGTDLNPSEAARRLRVARPSVMRLIARGELSSHKDSGHYVLSPRDLRSFQTRLSAVRQEAFGGLTAMTEEYGF